MREILFRGKQIADGEWVTGSIWIEEGRVFIVGKIRYYPDTRDWDTMEYYETHPHYVTSKIRIVQETVGQYTGLVDKNGNKIFEGDILKYTPRPNCEIYYKVIWQQEYSRFALVQWSTHKYQLYEWAELEKVKYMCEVIGNIHDDPELLNTLEAK